MLKLFLLRHGKAVNAEEGVDDFKRGLNKKGVAQINQLGIYLEELNTIIDEIVSSSAIRTKETAEIANHFIELGKITYAEELYLASQNEILKYISENVNGKNVLYVGHNFGISELASFLVDQPISMSTGMLVEIELNIAEWKELGKGKGKMKRFIQPNIFIP